MTTDDRPRRVLTYDIFPSVVLSENPLIIYIIVNVACCRKLSTLGEHCPTVSFFLVLFINVLPLSHYPLYLSNSPRFTFPPRPRYYFFLLYLLAPSLPTGPPSLCVINSFIVVFVFINIFSPDPPGGGLLLLLLLFVVFRSSSVTKPFPHTDTPEITRSTNRKRPNCHGSEPSNPGGA